MANNRRAAAIWHNTTWPWCEWNRKSEQQEAREQSRFWASAENERRNKKPLHWVETCRLSFHFRSLAECANYWCEWNHLGHESLSTTPHRAVRTAASCQLSQAIGAMLIIAPLHRSEPNWVVAWKSLANFTRFVPGVCVDITRRAHFSSRWSIVNDSIEWSHQLPHAVPLIAQLLTVASLPTLSDFATSR